MTDTTYRRYMSNCFDKLHEQLSLVRSHVEQLDDPEATKLLEAMESGLLAPMRRMRLHLDIPYDWHEKRPTVSEMAA